MNESFGEWVRRLRTGKDWNQRELAAAMKVVPSVVNRVELDQQEPTADFCIAFAAVMDQPVEYVLARAGKSGYERHLTAEGDTAAHGKESAATRKIRALFDMLSAEDQERAIELMETFVRTHKRAAESAPIRKRGSSGAAGGA